MVEANAKKTRLLTIFFQILLMLLLFGLNNCSAESHGTCGADGDNLTWVLDNNNTLTISGYGMMESYYTEDSTPWGKSIEKVVFTKGVKSIGFAAFEKCNTLLEVDMSDSSIINIEGNAFYQCKNLQKVTFSNTIESIGYLSFGFCGFSYSDEGIVISDSLSVINADSFVPNKPVLVCSENSLTMKTAISTGYPVKMPDKKYAISYVFNDGIVEDIVLYRVDKDVREFVIPENITKIGDSAFTSCSLLTSVIIPDSVTYIGNRAFWKCESLNSVQLPQRITSIEDNTFELCRSLANINIPIGITYIGNCAFSGCTCLQHVSLPNTITTLGQNCFASTGLISIIIPDSIDTIDNYAFSGCYSLQNITFPQDITYFGTGVISDCRKLSSIVIPEGVTKITKNTFEYCFALKCITIPRSVTSIEARSFLDCLELEKVCFMSSDMIEWQYASKHFYGKPVIYCFEYSYMESWANSFGLQVVFLNNNDVCYEIMEETIIVEEGKRYKIGWNIFPDITDKNVSWVSTNNEIGTIDEDGMFSAITPGETDIILTIENNTCRFRIVIIPSYTHAISFDLPDIWIVAKNTKMVGIENLNPSNADVDIIWNTEDSTYAWIDEDGRLTTNAVGTIYYTAKDEVSGLYREAYIHICYPVSSIDLVGSSSRVNVGDTVSLTAYVTMQSQSCTNQLIQFISDNESIANIDSNGLIHTLRPGTVLLTAIADNGVQATYELTVIKDFESIIDLPAELTTISNEAFSNINSAEAVRIPSSVISIADDAFYDSDIVILAPSGSIAIQWAKTHGVPYICE